jgi:guanylate kinase
MQSPHVIFGIVGRSGSGKSTLILEMIKRIPHLQVIKSTSTRPRRDKTDDIFYDLLTDEEFERLLAKNAFINFHKYNNYWYGTNTSSTEEILKNHCGIFALVENSVADVKAAGVTLVLIKITTDEDTSGIRGRSHDDNIRVQIPLDFELTIHNSFSPGGLEKSLAQLSEFIQNKISQEPTT